MWTAPGRETFGFQGKEDLNQPCSKVGGTCSRRRKRLRLEKEQGVESGVCKVKKDGLKQGQMARPWIWSTLF